MALIDYSDLGKLFFESLDPEKREGKEFLSQEYLSQMPIEGKGSATYPYFFMENLFARL